jgi:hypothetical protein
VMPLDDNIAAEREAIAGMVDSRPKHADHV